MFKLPHLLFMLLTATTIPYLVWHLKQWTQAKRHGFMKVMVLVAVSFDPIYWIWEWFTYQRFNWPTTLPLYLCSLFWLMMPFAVFSRSKTLGQMARANISSVVLFAGIFGLVFNTHLNVHPFFTFVPLRSLLYHYQMIFIAVAFIATGYYRPQAGDTALSLIPMYLLLIPCVYLSYRYGWDYAFTAGGIGTPLEALSSLMPRPLYLLVLYGSGSLVIILWRKLPWFRAESVKYILQD